MALKLENLDTRTRQFMLAEIEQDLSNGRLYLSPRLSETGLKEYPTLLKEAVQHHDEAWLAEQLRADGYMNLTEQKRKPKGGFTTATVPAKAPDMLAEGEFNRFYIRGLCLRAMEDQIPELLVYRARASSNPRPESEAKIGAKVDPEVLLRDLQSHPGVDTALGLPAGPNSGLSVRIP